MESFTTSRIIPTTPQHIYECWIDADNHSEMTGAGASSDPKIGGAFTAWDGYIEGTYVELTPYAHIIQCWWTVEFPIEAPDSFLKIVLKSSNVGAMLTLNHSHLHAELSSPDSGDIAAWTAANDDYIEFSVHYEKSLSRNPQLQKHGQRVIDKHHNLTMHAASTNCSNTQLPRLEGSLWPDKVLSPI